MKRHDRKTHERHAKPSKIGKAELSAKRRAASAKGVAARWGESHGASRQVRIDAVAAAALETVPEKYRREVASRAIEKAADDFTPPTT